MQAGTEAGINQSCRMQNTNLFLKAKQILKNKLNEDKIARRADSGIKTVRAFFYNVYCLKVTGSLSPHLPPFFIKFFFCFLQRFLASAGQNITAAQCSALQTLTYINSLAMLPGDTP